MSASFAERVTESMRRVTLELLKEADGYDLNIYILRSGLADFGYRPSMDKLRSEISWLAEQGYLSVRDVGGTVIATLTERGQDVAAGNAQVPGVARPDP